MSLKTRCNVLVLVLVMVGMLFSCKTGSYAGGGMYKKRSGIIPCPSVGGHAERKVFSRAFYQ